MPFQVRQALYVFLVTSVLALVLLWFSHREHLQMRKINIEQAQSVVFNMLELSARTALITRSFDYVERVLKHAQQNPAIENLAVTDRSGLVVASTDPDLIGRALPAQLLDNNPLHASIPIHRFKERIGALVINLSSEPYIQRYRRVQWLLYLITVVSVFSLTVLAWFLGRAMTRRLNDLNRAIASLAKGDLNSRVGFQDSKDEIGQLTNAFNEMVAALSRMRRQRQTAVMRLRANNEQLAQLVDEHKRTNAELKVEIALRQSTESREKRVLEASPDATMIVQRDGTIEYVNRQVEQVFSADRQALLGTDLKTLVPWNEILGVIESTHETLMLPPKMATGSRSVFYATGDGNTRIPVEINASALSEGDLPVYIVVIRDLTSQKKLESQTRQLQQDLIHMGRIASLSELATGLAHELNQPLTAITHNADAAMLTMEELTSSDLARRQEIQRFIKDIESQALRAGEIIKTLRGFVRKQPPSLVELDIRETIAQTVRLVERDAQDKDIDIRWAPGEVPDVLADPIEIAQVLLNLLTNATESIVDGQCSERWIYIDSDVVGESLQIGVEDSGPGIQDVDAAFAPFETTKIGGIGMGLHLCRNLILAHGGDLWYETGRIGGARFLFTLPLVDQPKSGSDRRTFAEAIPI